MLVSTTFLVQNQYYSSQTQRSGAQDNSRVATELMASEIRTAFEGGFVVAGNGTVTVRSPMVVGVLCDGAGGGAFDLHTEGGPGRLDIDEVAGIALRDAVTGGWTFRNTTWSYIDDSDVDSDEHCADNGADTVGASSEFHGLRQLDALFSPEPNEGDIVALFRETTFKIQASELDPTTLGLFRGAYGDSLVEFATGIDTTAEFRYRTGGTTYADTVTGTAVANIDAVRIVADARKRAQTGGQDDIVFGWSVNVPLRSIR
jgi:hypothetical protein